MERIEKIYTFAPRKNDGISIHTDNQSYSIWALYTINFSLFQDIPKENGNFVKDLTDASTNIRLLDYFNQKSYDDYDYHNYIINPNQAEEVILKKQTKVEYLDCLNVLQKKLENIKCQLKFTVS